jgi:NitT/TauT family transport system substrate-binding protein
MNRLGIRLLAAATVALLGVTGLAACGDDEPGEGGEASELRLGYFPNITHAPALVGVQNGILAEHLGEGVTLTTSTFNAGGEAIEALISGAVDATFIGPNPAINGWSEGQQAGVTPLHIIAGSTSGGAGLAVRPEIEAPADLRGTTLSSPALGNTQDVALRYWLGQQGYTTDETGGGDVSVTPLDNPEIITGYADGQLDGAWVPEPWLSRLVVEHGAELLVDEADLWPGGQFVTTHLIVSAEFLEQNPALVRGLLAGHLATLDFIAADPAAAQQAANDHLEALTGSRLPDEVLAASFENLTFTADPIAGSLFGSAAHAEEVGLLDPVELNGIYQLGPLNELLREAGQPEVSGDPA